MKRAEKPDPRWPCKIGTMPKLIYLHGTDERLLLAHSLPVGKFIRIREHPTQNWAHAIVRRVDEDCYFQADWM